VVKVVASIQIDTFRLLVDRHDGSADVQRAVDLPSLDLHQEGIEHEERNGNHATLSTGFVSCDFMRCHVITYILRSL